MKLNIYEGREIVKTYETDSYNLKFGTIEDVSNAVNLDHLESGTNAEFIRIAIDLVMHSMDTVKDLIKDVFDGITDEEIRKCSVAEMAMVIVDVVTYTMQLLSKNARGN